MKPTKHRMSHTVRLAAGLALVATLCAAPLRAEEKPMVEHLNSGTVLPADLPFSEAVRVGDLVLLSGQIGIEPGTMELVAGGIEAEARQTMENIRATLGAHDLSMSNVVKCTVMLADMAEWAKLNEVYATFFERPYPARSAFGASGLAMGARVEVECMAVARR